MRWSDGTLFPATQCQGHSFVEAAVQNEIIAALQIEMIRYIICLRTELGLLGFQGIL